MARSSRATTLPLSTSSARSNQGKAAARPYWPRRQLAAQRQRLGIARAGGDGAVDGLERAGNVAAGAAEAGDVGPDGAVLGARRRARGRRRLCAAAILAERHLGAAADARRHRLRAPGAAPAASASAARASPCSRFGMGEEVRGLLDRNAGLAGAHDLGFGGDSVAEREMDPRLHDPGRLVAADRPGARSGTRPGRCGRRRRRTRRGRAHRACPARPSRRRASASARRGGQSLTRCRPYCLSRS